MYSGFVVLAVCELAIAASINNPPSNTLPTSNYPEETQILNNKPVVNLAAVVVFAETGMPFSEEDAKTSLTPSRVKRAVSNIPNIIKTRQIESTPKVMPSYIKNASPRVPGISAADVQPPPPPPQAFRAAHNYFRWLAELFE
ncbi:uncharacterized protein LOC124363838 [Homalodisca vitripennis]|uniref:uncharacterized protein LOC124363838 n=1 Tax=Homalodisca vitripennis TaxID=197043 RepID=UPI001EEB20E8|nr:uncharacterized protein LOC124363838 [Homalodisca vitripennis]KAG8252674.1 hypothetical protein J6590_052258 [Homalodisca vitripennis]